MSAADMPTLDTQIRKLRSEQLIGLAKILNQDDCWKELMAAVRKFDSPNEPLFKNEHIRMIEQTVKMEQRIAAEVFLTEWSTMGKQRPTCQTLLDLLVKTKFFRAADYLTIEILKIDCPERPRVGPAAPIDVSDALVEALLKNKANALKNVAPNDGGRAWSLQFQEKPIGVAANAENTNKSDLIKFTSDQVSNLMQFSKSTDKLSEEEQNSEEVSNLIKFSAEVSSNVKAEDFVLPEARTEDIPLCVKEDMFQSFPANSSGNENSATAASIDPSDITRTTVTEEDMDLPQVSERFIPVVVFECTDSKSET